MKYIFLAIFVLLSAQPLQASLCDMCGGQDMSQHDSMDDMDCCDQDPSGLSDRCDPLSHCGACTAGVMAATNDASNSYFANNSRQYLPESSVPLHKFNSPPFRPPIG